jgi:sugar-specific transcriptional regulator TrmB
MEQKSYIGSFENIGQLMIQNNNSEAREKVEEFVLTHIDVDTPNESLLGHIVASSLLKRIDRKLLETKNIYLQQFDIPQIELFYEMSKVFPQVHVSHDIANQYQESVIKNLKEVTIFEIGVGRGKQISDLLKTIAQKGYDVKKVNIIGLDPDINNINNSEKIINSLKDKLNFEVNFYPQCTLLENFTDDNYKFIKDTASGNLLINSAFTLHHTAHPLNDKEARIDLLAKLKTLDPLLITIIEPNSDHDTENIVHRIKNCMGLFDSIFDLIDEADSDVRHKYLIKEKFFGREIRDIFGVSDYLRTERHEDTDSWIFKLFKAGFKPYKYDDIIVDMPDYCEYKVNDGHSALSYKGQQLVAVLAYTS